MTTKLNEDFDIEDKFDPNAYRQSLKERLGIANLPTTKLKNLNKIDVPNPAIAKSTTEEIRSPELIPATVEDASAPKAVGQVPGQVAGAGEVGAEAEVSDENLAPAQAILDTVLQVVDDQRKNVKDRSEDMMLRALHLYLYKNRDKIAKTMSDGAK